MEMQMRNFCEFDENTGEFIQIQYLCDADSTVYDIEAALNSIGSIKDIGNSPDKTFMKHGMFPVSIRYEKNGKVCRERENHICDDFKECDNIYIPTNDGLKLVCRMLHLQKRKTA